GACSRDFKPFGDLGPAEPYRVACCSDYYGIPDPGAQPPRPMELVDAGQQRVRAASSGSEFGQRVRAASSGTGTTQRGKCALHDETRGLCAVVNCNWLWFPAVSGSAHRAGTSAFSAS
ncbi:MAG: hypothetical protein ACM3ZE_19870, partial [Myxococcales bacterium]